MTDSTNTWRNQSLSSNGDIDLQDMKFDFEDYFKRHGTEAMSDEEAKEFGARVMGVFCRDFFNSDGDPSKVEPWVANYIAKAFYNVLGGIPWAQALPTPFDEAEDQEIYTPKGRRALGFYCAIQNTIKSHPKAAKKLRVGDLISEQARLNNLSQEAVRGDYYKAKKWIDGGVEMPADFLK